MSGQKSARQIESADAISSVLRAESRVREQIKACRDHLAQALTLEQEHARAIQQRTRRRLSRLHAHCEQQVDQRKAALRAESKAEAIPVELDQRDQERLERAVEALAAKLVGGDDG